MSLVNYIQQAAAAKRGNTATQAIPQKKAPGLPELVAAWQKDKKEQYTADILRKLQPTMSAAMTSYAGGISEQLRIPAANITLQALDSYDPRKGTSVQTHVFNALKRLNRVSAERGNIVHIPEGMRVDYNNIRHIAQQIQQETGKQPSIQQLSDRSGLSPKRITKLLQGNTIVSQSGNQAMYQNKDTGTSSDISDQDYMRYVYSTLGDTDKKIMEWSTGIYGSKILSGIQMAKRLKITPAAVSQRRANIQKQLSDIRGLL